MKKALLTVALLSGVASGACASLDGLFLGANLGLQRGDFNQKLDADAAGRSNLGIKVKNPSYPFIGNVAVGYFKNNGTCNYGAQLSVGTAFSKRSKNVANNATFQSINTKVSQDYNVALVGHFGSYVTQTSVLYGLLGIKRTRFDLEVSANGVGSKVVGKTLWAPVAGVGFKTPVSDSLVFSSEFSYEYYQKAKTGNVSGGARIFGTSIQPRLWNLTVGLSYKL